MCMMSGNGVYCTYLSIMVKVDFKGQFTISIRYIREAYICVSIHGIIVLLDPF